MRQTNFKLTPERAFDVALYVLILWGTIVLLVGCFDCQP